MASNRKNITRMKMPLRGLRAFCVGLILTSGVCLVARAQEQPPAPDQAQVAPDSSHDGPGRQLAHESREAAGQEKDEMEEFKQSASVKAIARITGLGLQQSYWLSVVINFAVILGVAIWAGK